MDNIFTIGEEKTMHTDCTIIYDVILRKRCTVKEFIDAVLSCEYHGGLIQIFDPRYRSPEILYHAGSIVSESKEFKLVRNRYVKEAEASGGLGNNMNFKIIPESEIF